MATTSGLSSGVIKNILGNVVGPLAGLASAPILAHSLGVDGRGEVAAATAPFLLVSTLATIGIPEAATYFIARDERAMRAVRRRALLLLLATGAIATLIALVAAPYLAGAQADLSALISLAALAIIPTILVGLLRGVAAGLGMWTAIALERALGPLLRLGAILALVVTGNLNVLTATLSIVLAPVVGGLVYFVVRKKLERGQVDATTKYRAIVGYGARVWIGSVAGVLLMRVDQVLMVPLSSTYELGLYVVAVTISELPLVVNTAVREVMFASDARSTADEALTRAARVSFLVCFGIAVGLGASSFFWVPILFGHDFAAAIPTMLVLLFAVVVGVPGSIAGSGLSARGYPQLRSYSLVIACAINIIVVLVAVPLLGALGAALATLVGNLISSNFNVFQIRQRFGIKARHFYLVRRSDLTAIASLVGRIARRS
ncbi:MAG: oligosaccharide flippase family protein [Microbacterium sp.]|uniref:oligosaccharide flippase family protein n=1 Tax=Microbacterium sp. TaxID=51671 RepID=UPI003F7EB409